MNIDPDFIALRFEQLKAEKTRKHIKRWQKYGINEETVDEAYTRVHSSGVDSVHQLLSDDRVASENDRFDETFGDRDGLLVIQVYFEADGTSLKIETSPDNDQFTVKVGNDLVDDFCCVAENLGLSEDRLQAMEMAGVYGYAYALAYRSLLKAQESARNPEIYNNGFLVGFSEFCKRHNLKGTDIHAKKAYEDLFPHRFAANITCTFLEAKQKVVVRSGFMALIGQEGFGHRRNPQQSLWQMAGVSPLTDAERQEFVNLITT